MHSRTTRISLLALSTLALPVAGLAGVKYWDNPAFKAYDADAYVQDGLVLHYDGIRNVGLDQEHSDTTTTWVNLANPGTHDLSFYVTKASLGGTLNWQDDGYLFDNGTVFREMSSGLVVPGKQTTQVLMDVTSEAQGTTFGYVWFPSGNGNLLWSTWSVSVRDSKTKQIWYNTHKADTDTHTDQGTTIILGTTDRPKWTATQFTYLTAIANESYTAAFAGTQEPTTTPGRYSTRNNTVFPDCTLENWSIGGQPTNASNPLNGAIKSFRLYANKVLSEEELVWNRAVDETRFFGAAPASTIPVTNAVVASAIASVPANEPAGAYAVDAAGYTFTAPATKTVNGRAYACTGYTLETWDAATGDWGAPESHAGELSCAATETSRIRIIWQWTPGDGIVTRYTTADYVQDGLVLHYDGIRNAGADQPHSSDTVAWKNLAPNGGFDMNLHVINMEGAEPGEWRADGYRFENESYFAPDVDFALPSNQTIQAALLGTSLDQCPLNASGAYINEAYFYYNRAAFDKGGALSLRKDTSGNFNSWIDWSTHGYDTRTENNSARPDVMTTTGAPFEYVTAVLADDFAAAFFGTTVPTAETSRWTSNAARRNLTKAPQVQTSSSPGFGIGGSPNDDRANFRGVIKNFRFYDRVLTNEELAQNRIVDEYRFHGVMPVTNVVVASTHASLSGNEANGNYEISGTYTFSAPTGTQTDSHGIEYALDGYTLETWDAAAQGWGKPVSYESASYTYTVATSPDKVRLTWKWKATKGLRTAADYGPEDVVPNGLVLHYDGIKNIGAECADVTNPTSAWSKAWVNLANPGRDTLVRVNKTTTAGDWTSDGFAFTNTSSTVGSRFDSAGPFTLASSYSLQVLLDAKASDQADATCGYMMFNDPWKSSSIAIRTATDYGANGSLYYVADAAFGKNASARPRFTNGSRELPYTYATAILDGKKAMFFDGTDYPTSGTALNTKTVDAAAQPLTKLHIGGGQGAQDFTGTLKSFRYYDRVLTEEELKRNRQVDSARYFGELAFTNVVVEVADDLDVVATPAPGVYAVEGSYTFTCAAGTDTLDGYKLQVWDETSGDWGAPASCESLSYTYDAATAPAKVRITWRKTSPFMIIVR